MKDLTREHPRHTLWRFLLPMLASVMFQQFYSVADSSIAGRFAGEDALAAVGASYPITVIFMAFAVGSNLGASVVVSRLFGAGDLKRMKSAVSTAFIACGVLSAVLTLFGWFFCSWMMELVHTPENIFSEGELYLKIYVYGLTFLFLYNVCTGIFTALGDSRTPLKLLIFSSLLNIVLDLLFVIEFHMAVRGVAVATLIAQGLSAALSFLILMRKLRGYRQDEEDFRFYDREMAESMTRVALPSILQQSIVQLGILLVQSVVNTFGSSVIAGYSAGTRIESISIVPMLAIGNAMSTFTAQNMGAGNQKRVKEGYRVCYFALAGFAVVLCVLTQLFGSLFISAFLDAEASAEAFSVGMAYAGFISFFYIFIGLKATTDGLLRGAGDMKVFTAANLANLAIRVFVANYFAPRYGVQFVWYAVPLGWAANYLISFVWYLTGHWSRIRLVEKKG